VTNQSLWYENLIADKVKLSITLENQTLSQYLVGSCSKPKRQKRDWEKWVMLAVIFLILFLLITSFKHPYLVFFLSATLITILKIITLKEFLEGFANEGLLTIALLFAVVKPVANTGILQYISQRILIFQNYPRFSLLTMMIMVAALSIFFNNTPIVVLFIPIMKDWCRKNNLSASKFLIPLSYASIVGGMNSLIGTSTNMLVHGFLEELGVKAFDFFEVAYIGLPLTIFMISYLFIFAFICLPDHKDGLFRLVKKGKSFISEVEVNHSSPLRGKKISNIKKTFTQVDFIEIVRKKEGKIERIVPVPENEIIERNDILIVSGETKVIMEMINAKEYEKILNQKESLYGTENVKFSQGLLIFYLIGLRRKNLS
jgi:di/tricarboxylate transporter